MAFNFTNTTLLAPQPTCLSSKTIIANGGQVIENDDGSISVYTLITPGVIKPTPLNKFCCSVLNSTYVWDQDTQKCMWSQTACVLNEPFKLVLNSQGNGGSLFYVDSGQSCYLTVDFDYLFNIKCETLANVITTAANVTIDPLLASEISNLTLLVSNQQITCSNIQTSINTITTRINNTPYSIICGHGITATTNTNMGGGINNTTTTGTVGTAVVSNTNYHSLINTGFGSSQLPPFSFPRVTRGPSSPITFYIPATHITYAPGISYCLTDAGLIFWQTQLGSNNYQNFLNGDISSFSCGDVGAIIAENNTNASMIPAGQSLLYACGVPFGTRTSLLTQLTTLIEQQITCQLLLTTLENDLTTLITDSKIDNGLCQTPISVLETLDVSMTIDVITGTTQETVYQHNFFQQIGSGNLYNYLVSNPINSGFYLCGSGNTSCTPMSVILSGTTNPNTLICNNVMTNIVNGLYKESNLSGTTNGYRTFQNSLSPNVLASNWLHYTGVINDPNIISLITNNEIKLTLQINEICSDVCVLVDNIVLDKVCTQSDSSNIFLTQSPGFQLDRIIDNKKSWIGNTIPENRSFLINNVQSTNPIRQTNYNLNDERLIINSKEIDLDISIASAVETDVWYYINNNPCILTATTTGSCQCITPPVPSSSGCCGDSTSIDFNYLMTQPLSSVTTVEDFEYFITSELIDAKNRQTLSGYPTIRALYDRYINSIYYCGNKSSAFDYQTIDQFAKLIDNYWVDLVEQVVPSTTIWGSVKIYSNTMFDQQKFKYRSYTSLFCNNQYSGQTILSPINGTSGVCASVGVDITVLTPPSLLAPIFGVTTSSCNSICIAQMNTGSEFIGSVYIVVNGTHILNNNNNNSNQSQF